ncbi:hypothetical protein T02_2067 [Trichinella nativa]|uniref:Uncharacterized protein n=1 Tax=Trichinella nativa TaxID=6335 RepID=A0A0V1L921_9BILA|nr:hypothetical protein T02_2067 [Trichinella nativa]
MYFEYNERCNLSDIESLCRHRFPPLRPHSSHRDKYGIHRFRHTNARQIDFSDQLNRIPCTLAFDTMEKKHNLYIRVKTVQFGLYEDVVADCRMDCFEHTCMQSSMVEKLFKLPPQPLYVNDTHRRA